MTVESRYEAVMEQVARACREAGRASSEVRVVVVSKTVPIKAIRRVYALGHRDFGESRWQEAEPKIEALPSDIRWHYIGHLQSNKARKVAERFEAIHTLCSESQLREIEKAGRVVGGLVEVDFAKEAQKSGLYEESLDEFVEKLLQYKHIRFQGLMTLGPNVDDPSVTRTIFRKAKEWNDRLGGRWLSMGMSGDFEMAIQEGATHLRIGSAIFGDRG